MKGKKSFVAYSDWKDIFDELPDEDAGKLIKHIFSYVNDEDPKTDSVLIKAVFANIKSTLKRDLSKWDSQLKQRSEAGKRSAEIRSTKSNERSTVVNETVRNPTVNDNVSVNDNVNVILLKKETKRFSPPLKDELIDYLIEEKKIGFTEAQKFADEFHNFYESNGWKVGKNPMKNWKGAMSGWISRADNFKPKQNGTTKRSTEDALRDFLAD